MSTKQIEVLWQGSGAQPECAPDARYPNGIDVDISKGAAHACRTDLPYPAEGIGMHVIVCNLCGLKVAITAAGRPDDPRSVKLGCKFRLAS